MCCFHQNSQYLQVLLFALYSHAAPTIFKVQALPHSRVTAWLSLHQQLTAGLIAVSLRMTCVELGASDWNVINEIEFEEAWVCEAEVNVKNATNINLTSPKDQ